MRIRLLLAAACIFILPLVFSPSRSDKLTNSAPFATVALAGHAVSSDAPCMCGCLDCLCDPGEEVHQCRNGGQAESNAESLQGISQISEQSRSGVDFGTGALMLALALFVWARLRA